MDNRTQELLDNFTNEAIKTMSDALAKKDRIIEA
jgi:hypothetical protein